HIAIQFSIRLSYRRTPNMSFRKCGVLHCSNATKSSPYQFYRFPIAQHKLIQRAKWIVICTAIF
ncbi:hypothetical protein PV325_014082, partial [Microctonus aethiopoides]